MSEEMVTKMVKFPRPLIESAERYIAEKGLGSFTELVRVALHDYLEQRGY